MPAYVIVWVEETHDKDEIRAYRQRVRASLEGHDATARVAYGRQEVVEGPDFAGVAMIEFPTFEEAKAWYHSPAYQEAVKHRLGGADCRAVIVEGV